MVLYSIRKKWHYFFIPCVLLFSTGTEGQMCSRLQNVVDVAIPEAILLSTSEEKLNKITELLNRIPEVFNCSAGICYLACPWRPPPPTTVHTRRFQPSYAPDRAPAYQPTRHSEIERLCIGSFNSRVIGSRRYLSQVYHARPIYTSFDATTNTINLIDKVNESRYNQMLFGENPKYINKTSKCKMLDFPLTKITDGSTATFSTISSQYKEKCDTLHEYLKTSAATAIRHVSCIVLSVLLTVM